MTFASTIAAVSIIALSAVSATAGDGRTGPETFTGADLDAALADMNTFLQARYAIDDSMALIAQVKGVEPIGVYAKGARVGYRPSITDGASLDASLARLQEVMSKPSLAVMIYSRMTAPEEGEGGFGSQISGDESLEANLAALNYSMDRELPIFEFVASLTQGSTTMGQFGPLVEGDAGLGRNLAALNDGLNKQLPIFVAIADLTSSYGNAGPFGPYVSGGESLDENLASLSATIADSASDAPYITGQSLDAYAATLVLY